MKHELTSDEKKAIDQIIKDIIEENFKIWRDAQLSQLTQRFQTDLETKYWKEKNFLDTTEYLDLLNSGDIPAPAPVVAPVVAPVIIPPPPPEVALVPSSMLTPEQT